MGRRKSINSYADNEETEDSIKASDNAKMWAIHGNNYFPCEETVSKVDSCQYLIQYDDARGIYFSKTSSNMDELLELPDNTINHVMDELDVFWSKKDVYKSNGLIWKRGYLLYGKPGCGKTTAVQMISRRINEMGGVSFFVENPRIASAGLRIYRKIEPDRPIVVILEDLDTIIESYGESDLLPLLDGENQVDNVVFVATTNYLSDLDDRIVNRPSRFDIVREVEFPTDEARKKFIEMKIPRLKKKKNTIEVTVLDDGKISKKKVDEMEWIVAETKGLAISHLKEYVIASEMLGNSREAVIKRLKKMQGKKFVGGEM